jgi:hypothetical protein
MKPGKNLPNLFRLAKLLHCARNRIVILCTKSRNTCGFEPNRVRIATLAFAARSSRGKVGQRLPNQATAVPKWFVSRAIASTSQYPSCYPDSASPRRLAVGPLFSLGSSVLLCALPLLAWFYHHPVVVGTRTEKRSIQ